MSTFTLFKKPVFFLSFSIIFFGIFFISVAQAGITSINLKVNKNFKVRYPTSCGRMSVGSDRVCITYKSNQKIPDYITRKDSSLANDNLLMNLLMPNSQNDIANNCNNNNNVYYFDFGLGRTMNYIDHKVSYFKKTSTVRQPDAIIPNTAGRSSLILIAGGYIWNFKRALIPTASLGVEYSYIPNVPIRGEIYSVNNTKKPPGFIYQYTTDHTNIRLAGKLNLYRWKAFMPYVAIGLGGSWNYMSNYKEYLTGFPRTIPTTFKNLKKFGFSYNTTIGLDYQCSRNFLVSLGYRRDNFGSNKTGNAVGQYAGNHLSQTLYSHTLLFTGRYLFS